MKSERCILTPIGALTLVSEGAALVEVRFGASEAADEAPVLMQAAQELGEYFAGRRRQFSVPLCMRGTEFQSRVWSALREIPYGETVSYGELARRVGNPRASRAVGGANHVNPLPIFVPCHRVVGADGRLTGYAGGLEIKRKLLEIEGAHVKV